MIVVQILIAVAALFVFGLLLYAAYAWPWREARAASENLARRGERVGDYLEYGGRR